MKKQTFIRSAVILLVVVIVGGLLLGTFFPADSLVYRDPDNRFSMKLPSKDWKEEKEKPKGILASFLNKEMQAMLMVLSARKEDLETFKGKTIPTLGKSLAQKGAKLLEKPEQGKNDKGNPYYLVKLIIDDREGPNFFALAVVWCQEKEITVNVALRAAIQANTESKFKEEIDLFGNAFKTCAMSIE